MREFYFIIEALPKRREQDIRVFAVEKGRKEQGNYRDTAKLAEDYPQLEKKHTAKTVGNYASEKEYTTQKMGTADLQKELLNCRNISFEERQEQLAFRKRMQESGDRRSKMAAAYGKE